ncbi:Frataxin-like domain-containing protein [Mrakia frigida]|uniref:ferroxidase n=1 Tax=Mrakia frigida TaxID=29902 RepID=UPI003FCBF293
MICVTSSSRSSSLSLLRRSFATSAFSRSAIVLVPKSSAVSSPTSSSFHHATSTPSRSSTISTLQSSRRSFSAVPPPPTHPSFVHFCHLPSPFFSPLQNSRAQQIADLSALPPHSPSALRFRSNRTLTEEQYGKLSDVTMDKLHDSLEELVEGEEGGEGGWEVEYSSGVLTLSMGSHGTYVINKQPPNKQIWLSSPLSGPKRFDYVKESGWIYLRDGTTLGGLMRDELKDMVGREVEVDVGVEAAVSDL